MNLYGAEDWCYEPSDQAVAEWEAEKLREERELTMLELVAAIGPRPSVASVLRMLRLRRGGRR